MFVINNIEWQIYFAPPASPKLRREDGSLTIGVCDGSTHTIYLSNALDDRLLWKVLCHELVHAAMFSYEVSLTLDQEELLADIISTYGQEIVYITDKVFRKITEEGY